MRDRNGPLPSFYFGKTYAPSPVWRDSAAGETRFAPLADNRRDARRIAARLYHQARAFERQTRERRKQDGKVGRNGLAILHALLFDFLNHKSGRLDPSYASIARAANISITSVWRGLAKLKAAGLLRWERRCRVEIANGGRPELHQESNAYSILSVFNWRGYKPAPGAPAPDSGTWGDHPPQDAGLAAGSAVLREGASMRASIEAMEQDPADALAAAVARFGRRLLKGPDDRA